MEIAPEEIQPILEILNESQKVPENDRYLRGKIERLILTIQVLESKQRTLNSEIKKQKRSLARKREELKKSAKRLRTGNATVTIKESQSVHYLESRLREIDQDLLQRSDEILDQ